MSESLDQQKRTNVSNKLYGRFRAEVVNPVHPQGLYMATVRLLVLWDAIEDSNLPYAEFLLPLGAKPSAGEVVPVEQGNLVWVEFPRNGDTRYPLITGSVYHAPDYQSNLPDEVNGKAYSPKRSPNEPAPPAYDRKDALYQRLGLREMKTHTGGWSVTHVATGTAIEITPLGQCVIHAEGDQFQSATGKHLGQYGELEVIVKGSAKVVSDGDMLVESKSNMTLKSGGTLHIEAEKVTGKAGDYDFK